MTMSTTTHGSRVYHVYMSRVSNSLLQCFVSTREYIRVGLVEYQGGRGMLPMMRDNTHGFTPGPASYLEGLSPTTKDSRTRRRVGTLHHLGSMPGHPSICADSHYGQQYRNTINNSITLYVEAISWLSSLGLSSTFFHLFSSRQGPDDELRLHRRELHARSARTRPSSRPLSRTACTSVLPTRRR